MDRLAANSVSMQWTSVVIINFADKNEEKEKTLSIFSRTVKVDLGSR